MYKILLVIFFIVDIILITLIMLQQNNRTDTRTYSGSNTSNIIFGSRGSDSFIIRMIVIMTALFFIVSLILGNINSNKADKRKISEWKNLSTLAKSKQTNSDNDRFTKINK